LPMTLVSVIVGSRVSSNDFRSSCEARFALFEQTGTRLNGFTDDAQYVSLCILSDSKVQDMLSKYRNPDLDSVGRQSLALEFSLQPLLDSRDFIKAISLSDKDGVIYQFGLRVTAEDDRFTEKVLPLQGRPYWTPAYRQEFRNDYYGNYIEGEHVVSVIRVVNDLYAFERTLGIERMTFDEAYIASLYGELRTPEGKMFIYNEDGDIVSSTDKSMLGANIKGNETLYGRHGSGWYEEDGAVIFRTEQKTPAWTLVLMEPRSVFSRGSREMRTMTMWNIVIILLFALIFLLIQNRTIIRPVTQMSREALRYREGNFKISTHTKSADEVGQLNKALQDMNSYIKNLIEIEYRSRLAEREMELEYLHMQINPHFLYNTLDTIRWMALRKKQGKIAKHIEELADLFRHSLNLGERYTTIEQELNNLNVYLSLQKARFMDTLDFTVSANPDLLCCKVIKLLMQPLVENAIVHGIEPKRSRGNVCVTVKRNGVNMEISVEDDGVGIDADTIGKYISGALDAKRSFALKNIHDRLLLEYGPEYGLRISGEPGKGSKISIILPVIYDVTRNDDEDGND
jgi:two-component system sensor histidine kinase YesM